VVSFLLMLGNGPKSTPSLGIGSGLAQIPHNVASLECSGVRRGLDLMSALGVQLFSLYKIVS